MRTCTALERALSALATTTVLMGTMVAVNAPAQAATEASVKEVSSSQPASSAAPAQAIGIELESEAPELDVRIRDEFGNASLWIDYGQNARFRPHTTVEHRIHIDVRRRNGLLQTVRSIPWTPGQIAEIIAEGTPRNPRVIICYYASGCTE